MKFFTIFVFVGSLFSAIAAPPQVLQLPPSVVAAGTTTTVDGEPWAYVIWNANDENWYEGARTSVFLSTNGGTSFTEQATMSLLTDPGAITPWISRAGSLGEDLVGSEELSRFLFEQWGDVNQQPPAGFPALLSTFTIRAAQDPRSANALRQVGHSRPLFRFLTGTGWAGPLGVGQGQNVIIELRNQQGGVVGRVELTAGENPALPAPGAPVHVEPAFPDDLPVPAELGFPVPPSTTQVDRSISLRWAVPEALRSQILLTRGFYLWRLAPGYTPPGGMTGSALVAAEGNGQVTRVIEDAAVASKIFKPVGSAESGPDVADLAGDPDTWFVADDNRRFDMDGVPFDEGDAFDYVVAPVDLLGRIGAVSGRGSGVAAHFIPPTVPDVHRVENTMVDGQQRLRVVWKANSNELPGEAPVTHYLILRSRAANAVMAADEVRRSSDSARHGELIYLGVVPHAEDGAMMNFVDTALVPQPQDFGNPYFYSIRAAHLGPLGYVISNPSPAVFGTLRDRVGLPAPTGHPRVDCPRVGVRATATSPEVVGDWSGQEGFARIRLRCHRGLPDGRFDDISWVLFGVENGPAGPNNTGPVALSRALFFGNGNRVEADLMIPPGTTMRATILAVHSSGMVSHLVSSESFTVGAGLEYQHDFRAISAPIVEMIPEATAATGNLHEYWTPYFDGNLVEIADIEDAGPAAWRATFSGATSEVSRFLLIQSAGERGAWENESSARIMPGVDEYFIRKRPGRTRYRAWLIQESPTTRDPADCPHEARPPGRESTTPIRVIVGLPIGSKEYRIYRRINDGELALLDQSTEGWDDTKVQTIVFDDALIPPAGGRIGYYGQVFDEHGNPSPLALLHERVLAMSQLPPALLERIESGGTAQNPTMLLRALCPSPGVARLEFIITPDAEGVPAGLTLSPKLPSAMANFAPGNSPASPPQSFSGTYAGPTDYHRNSSEPVILEAEVPIVRGQEYQVTALTIGLKGQIGKERSALRNFTWTPPLEGDTVPWPDRSTPEVLSWHAELQAFRVEAQHLVFSQLPHYRQISTPPSSYPVAIRIGRLPMGDALPRSSNNLTSRWDIWGLAAGESRIGSFGLHRPAGYGPSLPPDLFHQFLYLRQIPYGEFVQSDPGSKLFPFVVYRQQIAREVFGEDELTPDTDIIQASHLVRDIIWDSNLITPRPEGEQSPPRSDFAFFSDPHTGALLTNPGQVPLRADMCYFDNTPVTEGATYQYYLLHFDGRGEPDAIINAGTVKIPMP